MPPKLFDVHTHIQFAAFNGETDAVIRRALDAGIWLISVGTDKITSAQAIEATQKYPEGVYATVGLHPNENEKFEYEYYKGLAQDQKVVAIGECGLDYYRILNLESRILQKQVFDNQILLAHEIKKPLMIHCRNAFGDLIKILDSKFQISNSSPGIIHFFSGTKDDAKQLLDLGFSFSFGGVITFARDYDEIIRYIPLDRIILETDAPYVAPVPYRGKRNEPAYIVETAKKLAELKNVSFEEISATTTLNAKRIFAIN
ncbi:MAG: TatD family hydrolase [Parcubacteria group bacterium GW2011_GWB1_45_9]|nr:MAG: TatD family hydrolase [Parcubacteria group bacterium GW2011_GWB1_45_9]